MTNPNTKATLARLSEVLTRCEKYNVDSKELRETINARCEQLELMIRHKASKVGDVISYSL